MTQIPQSSESSQAPSQDRQADTASPEFRPYVPDPEPPERSRLPLILAGVSVALLIFGLVFWKKSPDAAEADTKVLDVSQMTAEQLAEDASAAAARELVRRLLHGAPAERAAASSVMKRPRSPRLMRNLAVAMALAQQKRANDMRLSVERETRMMEEGY